MINLNSFVFAKQCIQKNEAESIVHGITNNGLQYIEDTSLNKLKNNVFSIFEENEDIIKLSTEVVYRKKNSARTHFSEVISIMRYPDNKECVQIVTVRLPEKIRKMCDDQGAFGYYFFFFFFFFDFEKIDGVIKLTNFLSVGVYKDGTYCEELDKYMEGLN
ncbi:hypothetical protein [Shigella boydii]|uniref:hypothetical protein n=1 Tax=Shigella boydii TaxID=621 RepID=UPI0028EE4A2A|nr:hypothetical protein [Shigella boydii]WNT65339.1 hypothetical protein PWR52_05870 [Shigella boydii]